MPELPAEYLGDGVYASFGDDHIVLDLRGQDDTTRIALEPCVMKALNDFAKRAKQQSATAAKGEATDA